MADIAILTNARAADQRSMIGYGELLLDSARRAGHDVTELRAVSLFSRLAPGRVTGRPVAKLLANLDRFVATPLKLAARRAGLVHIVDPGNVPYIDVLRHRAAIVTVHDVIPYLAAAGHLAGFTPTATGRRLMAAILRRLPRFDRIVCVSENTRRDLMNLVPLDAERVVTIRNAVFQPLAPVSEEAKQRLRHGLGLPATGPIVLHVGSNNFYKNRMTVLETFGHIAASHPEAILLFVGPRSADLVSRAAALGIDGRVFFALHVATEDMAALYSAASVLLFPSLYEGFGYPVVEAQLCGTPVICSNAGSLKEVAGDAALIFDPSNVAGMAGALGQVLNNDVRTLVAAGFQNARRYDADGWRQQHERLYEAVLEAEEHLQPATQALPR